MVGEIRDLETAEIAVQASLTGHLVMSTLHTNTAVGAVTRLRDMGVEPFLLSSSLIGVLAQRLVRVLDPATRVPYVASEYECRLLGVDAANPPTLYRAPAAEQGYTGRTGIYELVKVDNTMRTMIHDGAGEHELERYARTADAEHSRRRRAEDPGRRHDARRGAPSHAERLMGAYQYVAVDPGGKEHRGVLEGDTPRHVRQLLRERQLLPVEVAEIEERERKTRRQFSLFKGISGLDLALLTRQLATLVKAGLPLDEALFAVSEHTEKPRLKSIILGVRAKVLEGHTLAAGLDEFPHAFPPVYRATVMAGEQAGQLDSVLERLADYTESRHGLRQKVTQAMVYPILLTTIALIIIVVMLIAVVPKVVGVFETTGQELPVMTRALIAISNVRPKLVVPADRDRDRYGYRRDASA